MIGGSGVHNHNSIIGPHTILQQPAWGLAQRGIATLCFDRRPIFNRASFDAHPDLDHEVVIDAASALAYAATLPEIDPTRSTCSATLSAASLRRTLLPCVSRKSPRPFGGWLLCPE
jgi:hypothetical protein